MPTSSPFIAFVYCIRNCLCSFYQELAIPVSLSQRQLTGLRRISTKTQQVSWDSHGSNHHSQAHWSLTWTQGTDNQASPDQSKAQLRLTLLQWMSAPLSMVHEGIKGLVNSWFPSDKAVRSDPNRKQSSIHQDVFSDEIRKPEHWPVHVLNDDRISEQVNYKSAYNLPISNTSITERTKRSTKVSKSISFQRENLNNRLLPQTENLKMIYVPTGVYPTRKGQVLFLNDKCSINQCYLTDDFNFASTADAVLLENNLEFPSFSRPLNQIWIFYSLESPINTQHLGIQRFEKHINITATYRSDSDIVTPYGKWIPYSNASLHSIKSPDENYAAGKTKKIAWFVSSCDTTNNRYQYALELGRYIELDIYGPCGKLRCPRNESDKCFSLLKQDYKFYLAFENSNCKDYITEKFYWNALQ